MKDKYQIETKKQTLEVTEYSRRKKIVMNACMGVLYYSIFK